MPIDKRLINIEFFKSSGPGGQHKNKRETAVRLTHLPTKTTVVETRERSQAQNLKNALSRLDQRLLKLIYKQKKRVPTKVSKSIKEKRLQTKKLISQKKKLRQNFFEF